MEIKNRLFPYPVLCEDTFSSNPVILNGICDALKFFADRGQTLDEKTHIRAG